MATPKITLYFDLISPFAYMAYYMLRHSPVFAGCDKTYVPVLIGGIMKATGNLSPLFIKNKDKWINIERKRWAKFLDIPICAGAPKGMPLRTLEVQRVLCAVAADYPAHFEACLDALYKVVWVESNGEIVKPEGYMPILESVLGKDAALKVAEKIKLDDIKKQLAANTEAALGAGSFGLPWMVCTNSKGETEAYWGVDHLGQVAAFLDLDVSSGKGFRALL
ncbi:hypothetical protein FQN57_003494 [Myotisia sp. PD_48]|nr:hypothetical protein FQN57_003494 [Myotisia sp. PD_48]